jgi:hypothetical protein
MGKKGFLILFLGTHLVFVVLQIHKHSKLVKLAYTKQKIELERTAMLKYRACLMQRLQMAKNLDNIKQYACDTLGMQQLSLGSIKKLRGDKLDAY